MATAMRQTNFFWLIPLSCAAFACSSLDPAQWAKVSEAPSDTQTHGPAGPVAEAPPAPNVVPVVDQKSSVDRTCGADHQCRGESCCTRIVVPASPRSTDGKHEAVKAFALDKYELTVGRVRAWDEAGAPTPRVGSSIGSDSAGVPKLWMDGFRVQKGDAHRSWKRYDTWTAGDPALPKNFIDWYTAAAVCHYAGGRLPTDAEWHVAVVGGDENRPQPWGDAPQTPELAVYNCTGDGNPSCSVKDILPVGARPLGVGRWGHMDLAGSMFEWTLDAAGGDDAVNRGGGFCYIGGIDRRTGSGVKASKNERRDDPSTLSHMVGARCAYDIEEGDRAELAQR